MRTVKFSTSGNPVSLNSRTLLKGWNITSTAGATVNLRDGGVSDTILVQVIIPANGTSTEHFCCGIPFNSDDGLYVEVASGTVASGSLFVE
jgi:hypothetical protein